MVHKWRATLWKHCASGRGGGGGSCIPGGGRGVCVFFLELKFLRFQDITVYENLASIFFVLWLVLSRDFSGGIQNNLNFGDNACVSCMRSSAGKVQTFLEIFKDRDLAWNFVLGKTLKY